MSSVLAEPQPDTRAKLADFAQKAAADYNAAVLREATTGDVPPDDLQMACVRARVSEEQFLADVATTKRRIKAKADWDESQRRRAEFDAGEGAQLRADIERAKAEAKAAEDRAVACHRLTMELQMEYAGKNAAIITLGIDANNILRQRRTVRTEEALRELTKSIAPLEAFIGGEHRYGTTGEKAALVEQIKRELLTHPELGDTLKRELAQAEAALSEAKALPAKVAEARVRLAELKRERQTIVDRQGDPLEVEFGPGIPERGSAIPPDRTFTDEDNKIDRELWDVFHNAH